MGSSASKHEVIYVLQSNGRNDPYRRMGPYTLEAVAQLYKEEQIDDDTLLWTSAKVPDANGKKTALKEWRKIRAMPPEFRGAMQMAAQNVPDRRYAPSAPVMNPVDPAIRHEDPPPVPQRQ